MTLEEELLSVSSTLKDFKIQPSQAETHKGVELLTARSSRAQRSNFLSKLSNLATASTEEPHLSQNVVFIDWDDTLMPTYALNLDDRDDTYEYLQLLYGKQIKQLDELVFNFFKQAARHARVAIVTNARLGWVEYTSARLYPKTYAAFIKSNKIPIVSAREVMNINDLKDLP